MEIKRFKDFGGKSIAIYHGLYGSPAQDRIDYLESIGYTNIHYPHIDFEEEWDYDSCKRIFNRELSQIKNVDAILGFSLGGYLAMLLAGHTKKNLVMVNPSLDRSKTKLEIKSFDVELKHNFRKIEVFFGENDTLVDRNITINFLEKNTIDTNNYIIKGMEHRTPINYFKEIISKSIII